MLDAVTPGVDSAYKYSELGELFDSQVKMHQGRLIVYENETKPNLDRDFYGKKTKKSKQKIFDEIKEDSMEGQRTFTIDQLTEVVGTKVLHCENRLLTYHISTCEYLINVLLRSGSHCRKAEKKKILYQRLVTHLHAQ